MVFPFSYIVGQDPFLLKDQSSDTIYSLSGDKILRPMVVQTPSIQSLDPHLILYPTFQVGNVLRMSYAKMVLEGSGSFPFPTNLIYSYPEKKLYKYGESSFGSTSNTGFSGIAHATRKNVFLFPKIETQSNPKKVDVLNAPEKEKESQLKQLLSQRQDDDNPIVMVVAFKE